ncbi:carbohydrate ABC transporter permease [Demequina sp. SYSU T00192]|uniref:Carbohydrate ABC transporter permease n=1 Tax=Demequina litoralis TaxID=3051660 RepID=A0ABT8GB18_9MICO|nr:carbohydrate ABC transporter permease [Demequina sp. SYSU T00192]MDN4476335.1 carbohydrate ABC transporter permease [Demequina sp. SYSU T00192]
MTATMSAGGQASAAGLHRPRPTRHRRGRDRSTALSIVVWALALYFLLPLVWLAIASTKNTGDLFSTFGYWFGDSFALWDNIQSVFAYKGGIFGRWALNTLLYAGVSAVGASFLATMAGYGFAKYRFPGSTAMFSIVLGAIMIPLTALALPTYLLFSSAGLTNTVWAIIVPSLVSPFGVFLMRVYAADSVPDSLIEAARVDGAGEFRTFFQVSFRLMVPGFITVLLFALVATWNNYFLPLIMLNSSDLYPLTVGLAQMQSAGTSGGGGEVLFSTVITGSFISIVPLIVAFLFLQRYWQSGLSAGSVKG